MTIEDLACAPPQIWGQIIRRGPVLRALALKDSITKEELAGALVTLGLKRRQFYWRLAEARQRVAGRPAKGPQTGVGFHIEERQAEIILEAIANIAPTGRLADARREAARLSAKYGIPNPSETAVRVRWGKIASPARLRDRLGVSCELLADLCGLELAVFDAEGETRPAHLLAIVDVECGETIGHRLFAGMPSSEEVEACVSTAIGTRTLPNAETATLGLSSILTETDLLPVGTRGNHRVCSASSTRKITPGLVLRTMYGHRVGRVRFRSAPKVWNTPVSFDAVPIAAARSVIGKLLRDRDVEPS